MFQDASYQRQARGFDSDLVEPDRIKIAKSWFDKSNADYWRNGRGYEIADFLGGKTSERWLTVGDGRFGLDAIRLGEKGVCSVLPTNLTDVLLKVSKQRGLIPDYRVENAERLSFPNSSFDYVFCKDSYHHFPRPMIALYEMLRVAKKGVILVEPNDRATALPKIVKDFLNSAIGRTRHPDQSSYEEDGNYIFTISRREIEKVALGMNIPQVAFKGLCDYYVPGLEFVSPQSPLGRKMRRHIAIRDVLCRLRLDQHGILMAAIFLVPLPDDTQAAMRSAGWSILDLPRNPYYAAN
ncbi:MAG TPA: class I SAM-dependent methyltransferase [Rhizomicrobium sp.]|nr:class I SAM-dependent methyltransferase [Rhizomicrobium sp.]